MKIEATTIDAESVVVRGDHFDALCAAANLAAARGKAIEELKRYFVSGNDVPVERATIKAEDFWRIVFAA